MNTPANEQIKKKPAAPVPVAAAASEIESDMDSMLGNSGQPSISNPIPQPTEAAAPETAQFINRASLGTDPRGIANMTEEELWKHFRTNSSTESVLPVAPNLEGFSLCWIPTEEAARYDNVRTRSNNGWQFVRPEECPPSFTYGNNRSASYGDVVSHNELILMKIPKRARDIKMMIDHHESPAILESSIKEDTKNKFRDASGRSMLYQKDDSELLPQNSGFERLGRKPKAPMFN